MRVKFSKAIVYTPEWNDNKKQTIPEQVTITLTPMDFDDVLSVMDAMGGEKVAEEVREHGAESVRDKIDFKNLIRENASQILKYAKDLRGLEGEDGTVSLEEVVKYPAFMGLAIEILMNLVRISMPSEEAEGNSEGQAA